MSKKIVKLSEFSVSNITISAKKALESGGHQAYLNYCRDGVTRDSKGDRLQFQVGPLSLPYGMNVYDKAGPVKYSMDLSLRGYEDNPKIKQIYDILNALDEFMIDQGVKNSKSWFKADLSRDVVRAFYSPIVKVAKDAEGKPKPYPPTIKVNLRKNGENFDVKVYDVQQRAYEGVPLEDLLVKGAQVTSIIECTSVWFAGSKFGLSWKAVQIRMDRVPESIRGYAFIDDGEAENSSAPVARASAGAGNQNSFSQLQDDEEEEAEDDDAFDAPAPAPAPVVKRSVVAAVAPAPTIDDDAEDHEPVPVPKKSTVTTKTVSKKVVKKA